MNDPKNQGYIDKLHPAVRQKFTDFINELELAFPLTIRITSGIRTFAEQQGLYDKGRTKPGNIVTWARPGTSYHNYGLAIDICPWKKDHSDLDWKYDFSHFEDMAKKYNLAWGGHFPAGKTDPPHYQYTAGFTVKQLFKKYQDKDFIAGTEYLNL